MLRFIALSVGLFASAIVHAADPLEGFHWKERILLIFDPANSSPGRERLEQQLAAAASGVRERQIRALTVVRGRQLTGAEGAKIEAADLVRRYRPAAGELTVVLVGKDGEEKARWQVAVDLHEIFSKIDAMPMRQAELRGR